MRQCRTKNLRDKEVARLMNTRTTGKRGSARPGRRIWLTAMAVTVGLAGALPGVASASTWQNKVDPSLATLAQTDPSAQRVVILQFKANTPQYAAKLIALGQKAGLVVPLPIIHGYALQMPVGAAQMLAKSGIVRAVTLNKPVKKQDVGFDVAQVLPTYDFSVGAPSAWTQGATGKGVGVAVIDSGIAGDMPDFSNGNGGSRVVASVAIDPGATDVNDQVGHGTHVAGIIAGNSGGRNLTDPGFGHYVGVAPDANLINVKIANNNGGATILDAIYGLQFVMDFKSQYNIKVANLSFESDTAQSYLSDPLDAAVEAAWNAGITVVGAAGNKGAVADAVQYAPANDPYSLTVGSVDENGTAATADDTVSDFSSRGTTQDGLVKPDVYAPGRRIASTLAPNSSFTTACATCIENVNYIRASGTSMAAPVVAGIAADLAQVHPDWTPNQIKAAIVNSTLPTAGGVPEVNLGKALAQDGTATANAGLVPSTMIDPATGAVDYTKSSWSQSSWSQSSWSKSSWSQSSWSQSSWSQSSWSQSSWSQSSWSAIW